MTKVGLYGIGLDTYWAQFEGLLDNLLGYQGRINQKSDNNLKILHDSLVMTHG